MFWNILKNLGKRAVTRGGQRAARGAERAAESFTRRIGREVSEAARGLTRRAPEAPSPRQIRNVARRPTTPQMAERLYVRPETPALPSATAPRVRTQAVSRTGRDTVARAGEAAARQADEAAGAPISRIRAAGRRVAYGPWAGTRVSPAELGAGRRALLAGRRGGLLVGLGYLGYKGYGAGTGGKGDGFEFIPEGGLTTTGGAGVSPVTSTTTADDLAKYEELSRQQALAEMGQFDPFATDNLAAGADTGMGAAGAMGDMGVGGTEDLYGGLRSGFGSWASNLRGYGTAKGAGIRGTYGELSAQALKDAAEAEAIARAASGDIGRIGRDYSAAATQDIQSPGAGGPTELTGLTPVTGESYDIPGRIADTSQIAADYVLRDLNLTRDDLNFMSGMAKQMGPAYEAQLNENLAMLIADKQFELEQSIFGQQAEDRRAAEAARRQSVSDYYDRQLALELMRREKAPAQLTDAQVQTAINNLSADQMYDFMTNFNNDMKTAEGQQTLRRLGINTDDPNAFNAYLAREVRAQLSSAGS